MKKTPCEICGRAIYHPEGTEKSICIWCNKKTNNTKNDVSPLAQRLRQNNSGKKQVCQSIIDQINGKSTS